MHHGSNYPRSVSPPRTEAHPADYESAYLRPYVAVCPSDPGWPGLHWIWQPISGVIQLLMVGVEVSPWR